MVEKALCVVELAKMNSVTLIQLLYQLLHIHKIYKIYTLKHYKRS